MKYTKKYHSRLLTREVKIGDVPVGGLNPIRTQSMTTTDTMNTEATVEQAIRIFDAGADYVRITAPSIKEAKNLEAIKKELVKKGYKKPLIADIHFTPNAAEVAARIVEKVRVNPGNYVDKKKFEVKEYTNSEYSAELEKIRNKFIPLLKICKEYGTAIRIGVNHGSLSDRIMSRYGDTALGMVESALEFSRICEDFGFYSIVFSMKSSNPKVMINAYRLLCYKMIESGNIYPLHLGVTEAGDGDDGRIKSSIGIGTLLEEGIGDTIRVSLTEEPEMEIPVCKKLIERYQFSELNEFVNKITIDYTEKLKRESYKIDNIGNKNVPVVILSLNKIDYEILKKVGYYYSETLDKWNIGDLSPDYIYIEEDNENIKLPGTLKKIIPFELCKNLNINTDSIPLLTTSQYLQIENLNFKKFVEYDFQNNDLNNRLKTDKQCILVINVINNKGIYNYKRVFEKFNEDKINLPVILKYNFTYSDLEKVIIDSSIDIGGLFIDGYGDGIWLDINNIGIDKLNSISFGILQATRLRISKTEYISCPSCGRTLFDLQETTAKVREKTNHLKGVKIAIMGCIVNGPGEMADADYGYVGSGVGKITLYKGKEVVKRGIDSDKAVDELIKLIKENGDWIDEKK